MILIPAFQPSETLTGLVSSLLEKTAGPFGCELIVINDGSDDKSEHHVFSRLSKAGVRVLQHQKNCGKGAAIKTGIKYAADKLAPWVITVDADGQHTPEDVVSMIEQGIACNRFLLGVREGNGYVPHRSRFGNAITNWLFELLHQVKVRDTQSGLRFIPARFFNTCLAISQNRYDYELEMLLQISKKEKPLERPIKMIYEPGNPSSHFRVLVDSLKIYAVLFRSAIASLVVSICDIALFHMITSTGVSINTGIFAARAFSIFLQFFINKRFVFINRRNPLLQFAGFFALVIFNSLVLIGLLHTILLEHIPSKVVAYALGALILYLFGFIIQRNLIFKNTDEG